MISRQGMLVLTSCVFLTATGRAATPTLTEADVEKVIGQAVQAANVYKTRSVIAVTDREGYVLGVYGVAGMPGPTTSDITTANAIAKAGTAAYLSSNAEAFTSRTAGFIIQDHFPPGISNTAPGPLTGVGLSSLPFSDINRFRYTAPTDPAKLTEGIANTSLSGNPGGVPLYKDGVLVGGVGVDANPALSALNYVPTADTDETIAVIAQSGYTPSPAIVATQVLLNGIRLPYTSFSGASLGVAVLKASHFADDFHPRSSPGKPYNTTTPSPFADVPGEVRNPIIGSPSPALINGQARLTKAEVTTILHQAAARALTTRGAIRNPPGTSAAVFVVVVDYYDSVAAPNPPRILGSFRTPDATIFSYDVAGQKARTALFFSNNSMALSTRAVGFLAQDTFPPGIDGTAAGPYGYPAGPLSPNSLSSLQSMVSFLGRGTPLKPVNAYLPNGITVFPGGFPLYRNGVLIGAVGVSGDGVDQDDLISASGTVGFEAPDPIRADQFTYRGARLPYAKFPQNASL